MIFHSGQDRWSVTCAWITTKVDFIWQFPSRAREEHHCELHKGRDSIVSSVSVLVPGTELGIQYLLNEWMEDTCWMSELKLEIIFLRGAKNLAALYSFPPHTHCEQSQWCCRPYVLAARGTVSWAFDVGRKKWMIQSQNIPLLAIRLCL